MQLNLIQPSDYPPLWLDTVPGFDPNPLPKPPGPTPDPAPDPDPVPTPEPNPGPGPDPGFPPATVPSPVTV